MKRSLTALAIVVLSYTAVAYTATSYQQQTRVRPPTSKPKSSNTFASLGIGISDLPLTFSSIQELSPLARNAMKSGHSNEEFPDDKTLKWKSIPTKRGDIIQKIEKLDTYAGVSAPMLRFQASFQGLSLSEFLDRYFVALKDIFEHDECIEKVEEIHSIDDRETVQMVLGDEICGEVTRLGIAYGKTRKAFGISPRETMFLYGLNVCPDGTMIIWGRELAENSNHLFPPAKRHTRGKMHLFAVTLKPTGPQSFDVEYVFQLECGGRVPNWLTSPLLIDNTVKLFERARKECAAGPVEEPSRVREHVAKKRQQRIVRGSTYQRQSSSGWQSLLVPV